MKLTGILIAGALLVAGTAAVRADDAKTCTDGIAVLKAEIAKKPAKAKLDKLNKALKGAERELGEKEYDECIDFVNDGKKAAAG
ncbi:hypothetical protein [Ancylobacter terrae]|uniref:hypothetical protein n=1 Tax=Ancylobacter sp. sgz301288 TaxID=3342077 RepID=UPI0038587018